MKYAYPAIIRQEDGGLYSVEFPASSVTSAEDGMRASPFTVAKSDTK